RFRSPRDILDLAGTPSGAGDQPEPQSLHHGFLPRSVVARDWLREPGALYPGSANPSRRRASTRCGLSIILPSSARVPASGLAAKAAMTRSAHSRSAAPTEKASLMAASWAGWIAILAAKPERRAARHADLSPT